MTMVMHDPWRVPGPIGNPEGQGFLCCGNGGIPKGSMWPLRSTRQTASASRLQESLFGAFQEIVEHVQE